MSPGAHFDDFLLLKRLGAGRLFEVFLARSDGESLPGLVALKRALPSRSEESKLATRVLEQAALAASVVHPAIGRIHRAGERDGLVYVATEYVPGLNLAQLLNPESTQEPPPWPAAVKTVALLCEAAHHLGSEALRTGKTLLRPDGIHLSNVFVDPSGNVKLTDVGISHSALLAGTDAPFDAQADVRALGRVLDAMLAGTPHSELPESLLHIRARARSPDSAVCPPGAAGLGELLERVLEERGQPIGLADIAAWVAKRIPPEPLNQAPVARLTQRVTEPRAAISPGASEVLGLQVGKTFGRYLILGKLAAGGMGEVWVARQSGPSGFSKTLILKTLSASLSSKPEFVTNFMNEARLAALINHPNVVQIFDFGQELGRHFIAMEYLEGRDLVRVQRELFQKGKRLEPNYAARIVAECCAGLTHAHDLRDGSGAGLNIVHRDVSLENIVITYSGQVKLLDFGIATASLAADILQPGEVLGKVPYLAPEQLRGEALDRRVDIWALGIVLYALLTGRQPFLASSKTEVLKAILHRDPDSPSKLGASVPGSLEKIIERAMSKNRAHRYPTAAAMHADLEAYLAEQPQVSGYQLASLMEMLFPKEVDPLRQRLTTPSSLVGLSEQENRTLLTHAALPPDAASRTALARPKARSTSGRRRMQWTLSAAGLAIVFAGLALGARQWRGVKPVGDPLPSISQPIQPKKNLDVVEIERPAEKPVVRGGTLRLSANLPCEVWLDGVAAGHTPVALPVTPGAHRLTLLASSKEGRSRKELSLKVESGQSVQKEVIFGTGTLLLHVQPWAMLQVDGQKRWEELPAPPIPLLEGRHELLLVNDELHKKKRLSVYIRAGQEQESFVSLSD